MHQDGGEFPFCRRWCHEAYETSPFFGRTARHPGDGHGPGDGPRIDRDRSGGADLSGLPPRVRNRSGPPAGTIRRLPGYRLFRGSWLFGLPEPPWVRPSRRLGPLRLLGLRVVRTMVRLRSVLPGPLVGLAPAGVGVFRLFQLAVIPDRAPPLVRVSPALARWMGLVSGPLRLGLGVGPVPLPAPGPLRARPVRRWRLRDAPGIPVGRPGDAARLHRRPHRPRLSTLRSPLQGGSPEDPRDRQRHPTDSG